MKSGQLIEYNMKNIFSEKSYTKCGDETISWPFSENLNWAYLWIISLKFYSLLLLYAKLRAIEIYWNWVAGDLLLTSFF